ncbi:MAG: BtpA/SgcQ family protein [Patescibacteria group bacterium]|nr:BtpA/SgcQ family protein [Patescibacteria group bacterium]
MKKKIIGMIHLLALPGYQKHPGMKKVVKQALQDLKVLEKGGVDAVLVENENDHPHQIKAGPEIVAAMAQIVSEIVKKAKVPVGVEVLLNDPQASLAVAKISGSKFIRTDYFVDKMWRAKYGEMEINPQKLLVYKKKIKADSVKILADIQVKYAQLLGKGKTISQSTKQAIKAGADGVIVTGKVSGEAPKIKDLQEAKAAAGKFPVYVGSGFSITNAQKLLPFCDGAIVGTSLKSKGKIDINKVKKLCHKKS